jgi:hypothetical protein
MHTDISTANRASESFNGKTKGYLTYAYQLLYTKTMTLSTTYVYTTMKGFILLRQCSIQITLWSFTLDCPIHNGSFLSILPAASQLNMTNNKHVLKLQTNITCCLKSGKTNPKYLQLSLFAWSHQLYTTADPPHWGGFQVKEHIWTIKDKG